MDLLSFLRERLEGELGFRDLDSLGLAEEQRTRFEPLDFIGVRAYFGSLIGVGLVDGDALDLGEMARRADLFSEACDLIRQIGPTARGLVIENLTAVFGILAFVLRETASPERIAHVQGLRRGSAAKQTRYGTNNPPTTDKYVNY